MVIKKVPNISEKKQESFEQEIDLVGETTNINTQINKRNSKLHWNPHTTKFYLPKKH